MREIKFRAWNGVDHLTKPFTLLDIQNGKIQFASSDTIIMQYTGLKDKNGKEIYEGDIMNILMYGNVIVIWNDNVCCFQYAYHAIARGTWIGGRLSNTLYKHESSTKYEVIGNIYQTPDLLNK